MSLLINTKGSIDYSLLPLFFLRNTEYCLYVGSFLNSNEMR